MPNTLGDAELKVMRVIWSRGDLPAREVAQIITDTYGWNTNTTYTLLKRCIKKGALERIEPNFICHALIAKEQVQKRATQELIDKVFDGSAELLFASLISQGDLSPQDIQRLKARIDQAEKEAQP
ncbi:MAG: BlaI/MecI/CopY family transcriptional regulator [Candidatus Faecousia sp.]|nr:BlaI/MecI/CopY family transcriptional regulator [Clostridiales bacterium]MDD7652853.1 BlaI/MecI/CopY family transcriptional regulator [Bacillota bacterium]MDY4220669.1 BlaI/MecI/CopY family transcriptional regulator [Candidatus Faecousia sp.]